MSDDARVPRPSRRTVVFTLAFALLAWANGAFCLLVLPVSDPRVVWAGSALMALVSLTAPWLRHRPATMAVVVALVGGALYTTDTVWRALAAEGGLVWPLLAAAWASANLVARARAPRQYVVGGAALVAYVLAAAAVHLPGGVPVLETLNASAPVLGGVSLSLFTRLAEARRARAAQEARERVLLAENARADERGRLAREMHDVVSHEVSLIVLQAGALAVSSRDPEVRAAADGIRAAGSRAVEELRGIIGVLHDPAANRPEPPGPARGEDAPDPLAPVDPARAAGQRVEVVSDTDLDALPAHTARALHRVVQESLANARKHAPEEPVRLSLRSTPGGVVFEATNPRSSTGPILAGAGIGLEGLRTRVEMLGGGLEAGPTDDGAFRVSVVLPVDSEENP
ncbi:histidine kinase [Nocardiopsis sp. MG754419]|uniref:sensor histidine kinase n=1 Tax=Nocardiopsis sp. MG754419 TaxID=2259865 RepID=UPI001BA45508|nr:histidine kinase [Nocardiopsis sp. MG754419]MBR8740403.1 hypothetical protein [Nocardiopsis sp. MG754419]